MKIKAKRFFGALVFSLLSMSVTGDDKLRFVTLEFAPFVYGENLQVSGPARDFIQAVCRKAEIECSFDLYPWRRAQELIKDGSADGMMVIGRNPKRESWLRFSPPLFRTEYGFFVIADNPLEFKQLSDIAGYRVGVFSPSNTATQLAKIHDQMADQGIEPIIIEERFDDASGLRKLAGGRLDAVYSNRDRGRMILNAEKINGKVRYAGQHQGLFYYTGFPKTFFDQDLLDRFESSWKALYRDGVANEIIESYGLEAAAIDAN